jgi:intracellular multiplication protein IcmE
MKPVAAVSVNTTGKLKGMTYPTATNASAGLTAGTVSTAPVILAQPGHIGFAVLDTSIKSTEPGPVMATIETGRFAGGKLLGGFVRHAGRVVIEFNELTMDHQTYSIQAVAITMDTARTALSTYTNYHVLYRYGWLIGAAVLEGLNNALQSANTSTYLSGSGLASVTHSLSNGQIALSAIGNVGSVLAPIMQQRFATPPTVHVKAGTGIGILFMKPVEEKTS